MSETYTAVYEKDGDIWTAKITEEPRVYSRGATMAEARQTVRDALAQWLKISSAELHVVDDFRLPTRIRTAQEEVRTTRTESDRARMMAGMTDAKSALSWAEELGVSLRDPLTVQCLEGLGNREISIDTFCHTITMAEDMARWARTGDQVSPDSARQEP
ncbi:MAG: type II toxin-antitoxin system HicB family antitoxin [Pseudonocardiaceae bacterium]